MSASLQVNTQARHISYRWVIDDISHKLIASELNPCFSSSTFTSSPTDLSPSPSHFHLRLYPKGVNDAFEDYLSVGLASVSIDEQQKCVTRYKLSLIDTEGHKKNSKEWSYCFSPTKPCSVIGRFVSKSDLLNPETKFIQDDKLIIDCQITILGERSSFGYFSTLSFIAVSNPDLMVELLHDLALNNRQHEFPDCVPLNLPFDASLEETVTHQAKLSHDFELPISSEEFGSVKMSFRKFGFPEVKSLSAEQTLMDLKSMLEGCKYCDVTLLVDGKQFNTCKAILASQSDVFEAMFTHDMKEKQESQVSISDVTAEVFEQFLKYLYTGKVSSSVNLEIMELLHIADKYIINNFELLSHHCENILCNQIVTTETVIELLQFSGRFCLSRLKQLCVPFSVDHCVEVIVTDSWKIASRIEPTLLMEMCSDLAKKHQLSELPDYVPLDSSFGLTPLEETMTHYQKYSLSYKLYLSNRSLVLDQTWIVCAKENPAIKFSIKWDWDSYPFQNSFKYSYGLSISYLSTPSIFVDITITWESYRMCQTESRLERKTDILIEHFSGELTQVLNSFKRIDIECNYPCIVGREIGLEMTIHRTTFRKSGYSEMKSLSRRQTLMNLKTKVDCGKHCDVVFLVEGKQFRVPKAILVAQSSVLEAMFINNDKSESQFSICDVSAEVFEQFLNYLYTGKVSTQISIDVFFGLLHFSDRYSALELTSICIKFIVDHCLEAIDKDYLKIVAKFTPKLMMEILDNLALQYRLNEFLDCVPLNLPFDGLLEETITHQAMSILTFESTNWKFGPVKESFWKLDFPELKSLSCKQLLMDLKSMFESGKICDVVLLVEGKQFQAHKSILVNRSNVFEAMFSHDMKEKMENRVEMHDVKVQVFEQFLLYLYTGKIDSANMKMHAMDLYVLADMHFLSTLSQMCLRVFGQSLTLESVAEQFELSDQVGLTEFKQVCTDYMNKTN